MEKSFTVQYVNDPKPGKKLHSVKTSDGQYISFDGSKVQFKQGGTYTASVEDSEFQGKTYLRDVAIISGREPEAKAIQAAADRFWMPFVSNLCAHAIQAGAITDPSQIQLWATAAKRAALAIDANDEPDF